MSVSSSPGPAVTGLLRGEMVLRGGFLSEPCVITGLVMVADRGFVPLTRTGSWSLTRFLTGRPARSKPLAGLPIFDALASARAAAAHQYRMESIAASAVPSGSVASGPSGRDDGEAEIDLGLDDDEPSSVASQPAHTRTYPHPSAPSMCC